MEGIYVIENNFNGMVYVGKSEIPERRFREHMRMLKRGKHHNRLLQDDYNKYGDDAFSFAVVETYDDNLWWKELEWIQYFRANNVAPIYNDLGQKVENVDINARLQEVERIRESLRKVVQYG